MLRLLLLRHGLLVCVRPACVRSFGVRAFGVSGRALLSGGGNLNWFGIFDETTAGISRKEEKVSAMLVCESRKLVTERTSALASIFTPRRVRTRRRVGLSTFGQRSV